ncbi:alpha/beta hydrolase [Cumulibacter soli]|uniref:alpha/beta hydrolase n=1 Tax=Cumulibacter soli TaxID=2546344 RepID=UPI001ABAE788|nr:alpha/beta hydrolase [Cumulibacter soli]
MTGLYSQAVWPAVVAGLRELAEGRGETLLSLRDLYHGRSPNGSYDDAAEATSVINCLDEERFSGEDQVELVEKAFAAAPIFDTGRPVEAGPDWCEGWPVEPTLGYPYASDIEGLPATLTVSVTGDALTPHEGGISLADTLGGSLLTVEGQQHGAITAGNTCVDAIVAAYLIDLELPAEDATCRL